MPMTTRGRKVDYRKLAGMGPAKTQKITKSIRIRPMRDVQKAQVMSIVKTAIARKAENKSIGFFPEDRVVHNSAIGSGDPQPLIPPIAVGDLSINRTGDRVTLKGLRVKGLCAFYSDTAQGVQKDLYVRIFVLAQKSLKTRVQVLAQTDVNHLLRPQLVGLQQTNYGGNSSDVMLPVNTDLFKVYYDKVFKLSGCATGGLDDLGRSSFRWAYNFKSLPANLTFDEGNGNNNNNFAPFVAIGYSYADGSSPDVVSTRLISSVYTQTIFEDS